MPFAVRKFLRFLPTGVFTAGVWYFLSVTDSVIAGNFLGERALAAMSLVGPVLSTIGFLTALIATGTSISYSLEMGRANLAEARERFSQGLFTVLVTCGGLSLFLRFGRAQYLSFFGVSPDIAAYADEFLSWYWPAPLLEGFLQLFLDLDSAEGDMGRCSVAFLLLAVLNTVLAVVGVKLGYGISACALATLTAEAVALGVLLTHLATPSNTLRLARRFSPLGAFRLLTVSFGDAAARLCTAILAIALTKIFLVSYGSEHLAALQVVLVLWGMGDILDGVGNSVQPLVTVYHGEGNPVGVRQVMRAATTATLALAGAGVAVLLVCPSLVGRALGVDDPALLDEAAHGVRLVAPVLLALALGGLFNSYYMCIERSLFAVLVSLSVYLVLPLSSAVCGALVAVDGFWVGLMLGPFLGLLVTFLFQIATVGSRFCPYFIDRDRERRFVSFTLFLDDASVVDVSRRLGEVLSARGALATRAALLVEETLLVIRDRNAPRRVLAEVTLDTDEGGCLTLRDDGEIFDITDTDAQISSLRGFVVATLMERQAGRVNLITTGFNRNVFRFKPEAT